MKILIIIMTSSNSPALIDNSAMPRASPPAETVPRARLNPLLSVAPTKKKFKSFRFLKVKRQLKKRLW